MSERTPYEAMSSCPSARPEMEGSVVFGVVGGTAGEPRLGYLEKPLPVTDEILALSGPVPPTEIFRFAAPCAGHSCQHFDGARCTLVQRIVGLLPVVGDDLPPCRLRPTCLWWKQEGKPACLRCPQVVSQSYEPTEELQRAATPPGPHVAAAAPAPHQA
jgi:hypothetical protein